MRLVTFWMLLITAIIHFLPVVGVLSANRIEGLYGVAVQDPNLEILLRHRAVLFAVVGGVLAYGALHLPSRPLAFTVGLVSVTSFLVIALLTGSYNDKLNTVFVVDIVALVCLLIGAACMLFSPTET